MHTAYSIYCDQFDMVRFITRIGHKVLNKQYIALSYLCGALEFDKPHDLDLGGQQLQQRLRHHRVIIILYFMVYC